MYPRTILAALLFAAASLAGTATAQVATRPTKTVDIGGRPVQLVVPAGQCELDRRHQFDASVLDLATRAVAGANEMLLHTAECVSLDGARTGRVQYLSDFTQVQVALQFKGTELRGQEAAAAKEICQSLRTDGAQIEKQTGAEIKDRVKNLQAGIAVNETRALGVLGEDQNACYSGILMNVRTPTGETRLILGVYAMGVLNGRLVFLYRFAGNPAAGAVDNMVQLQQQLMRDHVALNNQRR